MGLNALFGKKKYSSSALNQIEWNGRILNDYFNWGPKLGRNYALIMHSSESLIYLGNHI